MKASNLPLATGPGSYALLIYLENPEAIEVGRLGTIEFPAGFYAYIGSALNGLSARLGRHHRRRKKLHWHVDYLLQRHQLSEVIWAISEERVECRIANSLQQQGLASIPRFGSSDCRCPSHLFHSPALNPLQNAITNAFTSAGVTPQKYKP